MKRVILGVGTQKATLGVGYWAIAAMALVGFGFIGANAQSVARSISPPPFFNQQIEPVGQNGTAVSEGTMLNVAFRASHIQNASNSVAVLETFLAENPSSVWGPSLRANLAEYYFSEGQYTRALTHWEHAWESTKQYTGGPGRRVADYAVACWTSMLVGMGRLDEYEAVLGELNGRRPNGPFLQKFLRTHEMYLILRRTPAASYRCGWMVLNQLSLNVRGQRLSGTNVNRIYNEATLFASCSFSKLVEIAQGEQWPLIGVERPAGVSDLPMPSVMHLKQGHYLALLRQEGELVYVYDPMFGTRCFSETALNEEASGRFLVGRNNVPTGWRLLAAEEMAATVGRSQWFNGMPDPPETTCSTAGGSPGGGTQPRDRGNCGAGRCGGSVWAGGSRPGGLGMPEWQVTEPNINVWLHDMPISCQPAYGPAVGFELMYKQHDTSMMYVDVFTFGQGWNSPWLSSVDPYLVFRYGSGDIFVNLPGGGVLTVNFATGQTVSTNYFYNCRLTINQDNTFKLEFPDGRRYDYTQLWKQRYYYMTSATDAQGFVTHFNYVQVPEGLRLDTVSDHAGQTLYTLQYTPGTIYLDLVTGVTDRFGRSAQLVYVENDYGYPFLSQITDAAGMTSTVGYDDNNWPQTLVTPYGTTGFSYQDNTYAACRWVSVTEANGGKQVFSYNSDCSILWNGNPWLPYNLPASLIPGNLPAGSQLDTVLCYRNSFHWDQKQSVGLPEDLTLLTTNDMNKAGMRHWLDDSQFHQGTADLTLSVEIAPSASDDGSTVGQITWYDHAGKPAPDVRGTQIQPSLVAQKLPDGSTWYEAYTRNSFGLPATKTSTYGTANPAATRSFSYSYSANDQDVIEVRRPGNELVSQNTFNTRHQKLTEVQWPDDATGYTNTWTYDSQGRVQSETTAGGLTRTFTYNAYSGTYEGYLSGITEQPTGATESFTWQNGNTLTHTDARGLTLTYTRDGLNRLTQTGFPAHDGISASSMQYSYVLLPGQGFNNTANPISILDVTAVKDRRDKWTYYGYDEIRRETSVQDPLNHITRYTYCGCGGAETITDARNKTTTFTYNNAGWKMSVVYGDNTTETYGYDALGRLTSRTDSLGSRTFSYNNQGLLVEVDNAFGAERLVVLDINDRPQSGTGAHGVTTTKTFDRLGRQLTSSIQGQNTELFAYSALGLTNYTGPDTKITGYAYDASGHKITEITPKNETIRYTNSAAGDLLSLTDGRNKTTAWTYDIEGLVRTKKYHGQSFANIQYSYDANQRLAWRKFWSSSSVSAQTTYGYDDAGNLTSIDYPTSPDVSFTYNEVNQKLTMTTVGLGTTTYTYTDAEKLASEYGLWANDKVSSYYHPSVPGLRTNVTVTQPSGTWSQTYGYDAARRLQAVTSPAGTFVYTYKGATTFWTNLALPNMSAITNSYDNGGRILSTSLRKNTGVILNQHAYLYNASGQRQRQTLTDGSYTTYGYDDDGQLLSSLGYTAGGVPLAAEQLNFGYDPGWNMTNRSVNGAPTSYPVNDLNEVTNDVTGSYYYDQNGNRTNKYASYNYTYDDENRQIMVSDDVGHTFRTAFTYDGLGRLRVRLGYQWLSQYQVWASTAAWQYLYDGMRVVQERVSGTLANAYTRGQDLSGTLEGAGGIGGLLARSSVYSGGSFGTHHFYHADGNGNVTYMATAAQTMAASYKYDAYGRTIAANDPISNVYRFSSKELMLDSGLYYYGYRFYDPSTQRWLNRDPFREKGFETIRNDRTWSSLVLLQSPVEVLEGPNLSSFVHNNPIGVVDVNGLTIWPPGGPPDYDRLPTKPDSTPSCKRDCLLEAAACGLRGLGVCSAFEVLFPLKTPQPYPYRLCIYAYGIACGIDKLSCDKWNKDHGFN